MEHERVHNLVVPSYILFACLALCRYHSYFNILVMISLVETRSVRLVAANLTFFLNRRRCLSYFHCNKECCHVLQNLSRDGIKNFIYLRTPRSILNDAATNRQCLTISYLSASFIKVSPFSHDQLLQYGLLQWDTLCT